MPAPKTKRGNPQELSLLELLNTVMKQQAIYGEKVERVYDIFSGTMEFPKEVTNKNDSPGLFPDTGLNVYAILPEYSLAESFCTVGILFNLGQGRYKYQMMLVQSDELRPIKNGKWYYRYAKVGSNTWSNWQRFLYAYELTGGKDENGKPILDDFGKPIKDTEGETPEENPHNNIGNKTIVKVDKAHEAEKLVTPRKIQITGIVQGETMFDGTRDVQIDTSAEQFYVPINIKIEPKFRERDEYHLICELPQSTDATYDYVIVTGHIGGWETNQGKCWFTCTVSNRSSALVNGLYIGTIGGNDLVVYRTAINTLKIYLKCRDWGDDMVVSVYGSKQAIVKHEITNLESTSTLVWSLKSNAPHIENKVYHGDVNGVAERSKLSDRSDKVNLQQHSRVGGILYAVGATGESDTQTLYTDRNIQFTQDSKIQANEFIGSLNGNAMSADLSKRANQISVARNPSKKSFLLATNATETQWSRPVYDEQIYLKDEQGILYADRFESRITNIYNLTVTQNTVTTKLNIPSSCTIASETQNANFYHLNITGGTNGKVFMNEGQLVFSNRAKNRNVIFNVATADGEGVFIARDGSGSCLKISGSLSPDRVYNAVYNDIAELFPCTVETEPGDVMMLDLDSDKETYIKSTENAKCAVGVVSDSYGYLLGGESWMTNEELHKNYTPIGLAGRVLVNVVGKSEKGAKLVATDNGCARIFDNKKDTLDQVIGFLLEEDNLTEKRKLKMKIYK